MIFSCFRSALLTLTLLAFAVGAISSALAATDEVKTPAPIPAAAETAPPPTAASADAITVPTTDSGQTHFRVLPPKIKPVQTGEEISGAAPTIKLTPHTTLDKLTLVGEPSFDTSFWGDTNLKTITAFLQSPTPIIRSPSVRALLTKTTLTPTDDADEDYDVYSLRIAKLLEIGDFAAALALYKLNEEPPPSPLAARAGVESMLSAGELGVACLEQKALPAALKTDSPDVWDSLRTFCQSLLGPANAQDEDMGEYARLQNASRVFLTAIAAQPPADLVSLNQLNPLQLMAFAHTGMLNHLLKVGGDLSVLHDKTLKVLIISSAANRGVTGRLLAEALPRGLMQSADLDKIFASPVSDAAAPAVWASVQNDWKSFLQPYNARQFAPSPLLVTESNKVGGIYALQAKAAAFAAAIEEETHAANLGYNRQVLALLIKTNQGITAEALKKAYPQDFTAENHSAAGVENERTEKLLTDIFAGRYKDNPRRIPQIMALQGVQSGKAVKESEQKSVYDNIFSLTPSDNYVMPNGENLSNLQKSADKKLAGQVVIDSLRILSGESLQRIHPAALYKILTALDSVGLNEETVALARDVLGDIIEDSTKEK